MSKWTKFEAYVAGPTPDGRGIRIPPDRRKVEAKTLYWDKRRTIDDTRKRLPGEQSEK